MAELKLTEKRLELLRSVDRGEVTGYPRHGGYAPDYYQDPGGRSVSSRVRELFRARWVEPGRPTEGASFRVRLTEAGRKVLEEADRG